MMVPDFGFETPVVGLANFQYDPSGSYWSWTGSAGIAGNNAGINYYNPGARQGVQVGFVQGAGSSFSQSVSGWTAGIYLLSCFAA